MDLSPHGEAFWHYLSLTAYNIQVEYRSADPFLRRLVGLVNTLDVNLSCSEQLRALDERPETLMLDENLMDMDHQNSTKTSGYYYCPGKSEDFESDCKIKVMQDTKISKEATSASPTRKLSRCCTHTHFGDQWIMDLPSNFIQRCQVLVRSDLPIVEEIRVDEDR